MKVRVTWRDGFKIHAEECDLVSEGDRIYIMDGTPLDSDSLSIMMTETGLVFFEDANGLFGLFPNQIVKVDPI